MRTVRIAACGLMVGVVASVAMAPDTAHAGCRTFTAGYNGTNMMGPSGAAESATFRVMDQIEDWKRRKRIGHVRLGKVRTRCGRWFIKYFLPHTHCKATVRACWKSRRSRRARARRR